MSDSTQNLDQLATGQSNLPLRINELLDAASPATLYGRRAATTTGLTWGYYGGRWGGFAIANNSLVLPDNATSYLSVKRSDGVISASTATTHWADVGAYARAYKVTTAGGVITAYEDHRAGAAGVLTASGGAALTNPMTAAGDMVVGGASGVPARLPAGTNGHILTLVSGVPVWAANAGAGAPVVAIPIACGDETTALAVGAGKVTFRMPHGFNLSSVRASVTSAPTGQALIVDINESGASLLSTKLSIDAGEKSSVTAATAAVISDAAIADDAEITIDIDQVGSAVAGAGLKVYLIGTVV